MTECKQCEVLRDEMIKAETRITELTQELADLIEERDEYHDIANDLKSALKDIERTVNQVL